jgi:hypothetical protein
MVRSKITPEEGPTKKKVFLKVRAGGAETEYTAVYKDLEIGGLTRGGRSDVKKVLRRIIRAYNDLPEDVVRAAITVINHILSAVNLGVKEAWGGVSVEVGDNDKLTLRISLYHYIDNERDESGWAGEIKASFIGYDGLFADSSHTVIKRVNYGEDIDAMSLYRELIRVARHAYNAIPSY